MLNHLERSIALCLALLCLGAASVRAQAIETVRDQVPESAVTVSMAGEQARFTATAGVVQIRLEVFTANGEKLFDSDFKSGNVLDWPMRDQQSERLADGTYRCVITARDLTGRSVQKRGEMQIRDGTAAFEKTGDEAAIQDASARNLIHRDLMLAVMRDGLTHFSTVLVHDGDKGRLVSGSGGLSFGVGDFFAGKDVERMRLTPEGNLGIGVEKPAARLDVAGLIRAGEGILFPDGTIQTSAAGSFGRIGRNSDGKPSGRFGDAENLKASALNIGGSGSTNRVTKWLDGPNGVVGDSGIVESSSGNVGIGVALSAASGAKLTVSGGGMNTAIYAEATGTGSNRVGVLGRHSGNGTSPGVQGDSSSGDANAAGVLGQITSISPGSFSAAVRGIHNGTGGLGIGVYGSHNGTGFGVYGKSGGIGVFGSSSHYDGVFGESAWGGPPSTSVAGVRGVSTGLNGNGVLGEANSGANANGLWGKSASGIGVRGETNSSSASSAGVLGLATTTSLAGADTAGVRGINNMGSGVEGIHTGGIGIHGTTWAGVKGTSANGIGVIGTGGFFGVFGHSENGTGIYGSSTNGDAGRFDGRVVVAGTTVTQVLQITGGADFAEQFEVNATPESSDDSPSQIRPGAVVSIDPAKPGKLAISSRAYDRRVAGIISGAGGVKPGMMMSQTGSIADGNHPVALSGRVYCWADASGGAIEPSDLLTTSNLPGHAMKATDQAKAQGAIIGKAMTSLKEGQGLVLVLVSLQ